MILLRAVALRFETFTMVFWCVTVSSPVSQRKKSRSRASCPTMITGRKTSCLDMIQLRRLSQGLRTILSVISYACHSGSSLRSWLNLKNMVHPELFLAAFKFGAWGTVLFLWLSSFSKLVALCWYGPSATPIASLTSRAWPSCSGGWQSW